MGRAQPSVTRAVRDARALWCVLGSPLLPTPESRTRRRIFHGLLLPGRSSHAKIMCGRFVNASSPFDLSPIAMFHQRMQDAAWPCGVWAPRCRDSTSARARPCVCVLGLLAPLSVPVFILLGRLLK